MSPSSTNDRTRAAGPQRGALGLPAQHVGPAARAEVEVGDDECPQRSILAEPCRLQRPLADHLREHEADVLVHHFELLHVGGSAGPEELDQPLHELLRRARPGGDSDHALAGEPLLATSVSLSIRCESAPCSRATSTSRFEFEELREPITSTRSHCAASCLTAAWRLVVA